MGACEIAPPAYGFEGSEKRLEVDFIPANAAAHAAGLRGLTRPQLDELCTAAHCCIVSERHGQAFDAYVLSESSLFVYETKLVLKTCGTTALLTSLPVLLSLTAAIGMAPRRAKYSRACFKYPEAQPAPHTSFDDEVAFLEGHFGHLGAGGQACVLGSKLHSPQWHVYVADAATTPPTECGGSGSGSGADAGTFSLEVCMTDLDPAAAALFVRGPGFISAAAATAAAGIPGLLPGAEVDDYVFEPCGYSMNGLESGGGAGFLTIHITPEAGFSYASVEISGVAPGVLDPARVAALAAAIFRPGRLAVALSWDGALACKAGRKWEGELAAPPGYVARLGSHHQMAAGGAVAFRIYEGPAEAAAHAHEGLARANSELMLVDLDVSSGHGAAAGGGPATPLLAEPVMVLTPSPAVSRAGSLVPLGSLVTV